MPSDWGLVPGTIWLPSGRRSTCDRPAVQIARAMGIEVSCFYEGLHAAGGFIPSPSQRMLLDLARNFLNFRIRAIGKQSSRSPERSPRLRRGTTGPREVLVADHFQWCSGPAKEGTQARLPPRSAPPNRTQVVKLPRDAVWLACLAGGRHPGIP